MTRTASYKTGVLALFVLGLGGFFTGAGVVVDGRAVPAPNPRRESAATGGGDAQAGQGGECTCRGANSPASMYSKPLYYRQLYCLTGYHLQILDDGKVSGTKFDHDIHAIMLIESTGMGVITIKGVKSDYYLAMNETGKLYGRKDLTEECHFREQMIDNWYMTYSSNHHPKTGKKRKKRRRVWFVGLDTDGSPRKGPKAKVDRTFSHFRTKPVDPRKVPQLYHDGKLPADSTSF